MSELEAKLADLIHKLDTATGMLIVASIKDTTVRKAFDMITEVSIELGIIAENS